MKSKIIIFEGIDKSGKSTLLTEFNKLTNYKYWVLDRGVVSSLVYNKAFHREDEKSYLKLKKHLLKHFDVRIIYCHANEKDIINRLKNHNEVLPENLKDFKLIESYFREYLFKCNYLDINTSVFNKRECLDKIINFVGD